MSLVIVWGCRQARSEGERQRESELVSSFDLLHSSESHCGTLHLINQTLIRVDLGPGYTTALNKKGRGRWGRGKKNNKQANVLLRVRAEAAIPSINIFSEN